MKLKERTFPYWQAILDILKYQAVSKLSIGIWIFVLGRLAAWVLASTGRVAVTSGDFAFIFTSWQGILLILVALATLFIYVAFDLNTKIIFSGKLLHREKQSIWQCMKEALFSIRRFFCPHGIGVVLYVALLAPILGLGMSVSLTESLYIPTFITSVIESTPLYLISVSVLLAVFAAVGILNMFILHGVVLDHMQVKEADAASKQMMKQNWMHYIGQNLLYAAAMILAVGIVALIFLVIPLSLIQILPFSASAARVFTIFLCIVGSAVTALVGLLATPFYVMKITELYYAYKAGEHIRYPARERRKHPVVIGGIAIALLGAGIATAIVNQNFDEFFPQDVSVGIIAHRAGGNEAPENTVKGLNVAYELGASGAEIDIQRTLDGYYIVNHDSTFERVAGVNKKPEEMTLAEIRELSVDGEPVATFEEMLEGSRERMTLYVELKGNTADQQMVDDAVKTIREYGMEDQTVLISLKYDLITYTESTYPEMQTGYLIWASFGNTAALSCDYIGMEEESATSSTIEAIHEQGKKALVWTANEKKSQRHFLCSNIDGLITDNVAQAADLIRELESRSDLQRIIDRFLGR